MYSEVAVFDLRLFGILDVLNGHILEVATLPPELRLFVNAILLTLVVSLLSVFVPLLSVFVSLFTDNVSFWIYLCYSALHSMIQ